MVHPQNFNESCRFSYIKEAIYIMVTKSVPVMHRYLARSAENLTNQTLKVSILWKDRPYIVDFCHSKTIPFLLSTSLQNHTLCSINSCKNRTLSVLAWAYAFPGAVPPRARCNLYFDTQMHGLLPWADIDRKGNIFVCTCIKSCSTFIYFIMPLCIIRTMY